MVGLGFSLQPKYELPLEEVIRLLAKAGFSAVSPVWSPELDMARLTFCTDRCGMTVQSLHAPHRGIPLLWQPDTPESLEVQRDIFRCIDDCARYGVPVMVLHCWQGLQYTFPEAPLDYGFFDTLADYAEERGVCVALENLEGEEYLEALLTRYHNKPHIGYCWDSGHDHCYPHKIDFLEKFGPRLMMTHLNDNRGLRDPSGVPSGDDDLHFLPFDGSIPWTDWLQKLRNAPRQEILNFEFKIWQTTPDPEDLLYARLSLEEFIRTAGERAGTIREMYEKGTPANSKA